MGSTLSVNLVKRFGLAMIEYVEIEIGGQVIDKQYGEWLYIWNELFLPREKKDLLNEMIGNTFYVIFTRNVKHKFPF